MLVLCCAVLLWMHFSGRNTTASVSLSPEMKPAAAAEEATPPPAAAVGTEEDDVPAAPEDLGEEPQEEDIPEMIVEDRVTIELDEDEAIISG